MNDLIQWLINFAYDHDISVITTRELKPDTPSQSDVKQRIIVINMNWSNKFEIPFIYAHEISHILCDHLINSPTNEIEANQIAINLLTEYCWDNDIYISNPVHFCEEFGIPLRLSYLMEDMVKAG